MKKLFIILLSFFLLCNTITPQTSYAATKKKNTSDTDNIATESVTWPKGPKASSLSSESAVLIDAKTGLILYAKNMNKKQYPASITKIMTSLLCVENCSLGEIITFTKDDVWGLESGASNIGTNVGEKMTMEQCLYAIMLESANEVCLGVANHIAGSIPKFSDMMNKKAKELGCKNTHFSNPNGLHGDDHYTSAYDMALIGRAALQNSTFRKVTGTKKSYIPKTNKSKERYLTNHHKMLTTYQGDARFLYDNCIGGKTGYTSKAMSTLVTFGEKDGMELVCVVMRGISPVNNVSNNIYTDTRKLLEFGFTKYTVYDMNQASDHADTNDSGLFDKFNPIFDMKSSPLQLGTDGMVILPNSVKLSEAKQTVEFYNDITLQDGQNTIGSITYTYGNKIVGFTNIYFNKTASLELNEANPIQQVKRTKTLVAKEQKTVYAIWSIVIIASLAIITFAVLYIRSNIKRRSLLDKRNSFFK